MKKLLSLVLLLSAPLSFAMEGGESSKTPAAPNPTTSVFGTVYKQLANTPGLLDKVFPIIIEGDMASKETQQILLKTLNLNSKSASTLFNLCNHEQLLFEYKTVLVASGVAIAMGGKKLEKLVERESNAEEKLAKLQKDMANFEAQKKALEEQRKELIAAEYVRLSQLMREVRTKEYGIREAEEERASNDSNDFVSNGKGRFAEGI